MVAQNDLQAKALQIFEALNKIPRCSGNERAISDWLVNLAHKNNWKVIQDEAYNVVMDVPGKKECAFFPKVILQGHMDMVCVKTEDSRHNFQTDPILMEEKNGWLSARGTTLGADNGIALAISLAIAQEPELAHPPLELLFTTDEERSLKGATNLSNNILTGKYLINIDSDQEGVFTIGCAGGQGTSIDFPMNYENLPTQPTYIIEIKNLRGGHSGSQINEQIPNAIKLLSSVLYQIMVLDPNFRLLDITGGVAHNAIPSSAKAQFCCSKDEQLKSLFLKYKKNFWQEYGETDPQFDFLLSASEKLADDPCEMNYPTLSDSQKAILLLVALPHGVVAMNKKKKKLVETSCNLAQVKINKGKLLIGMSQRSNSSLGIQIITEQIETCGKLAGAAIISSEGYPAWEPDWEAPLIKKAQQLYSKLFQKEPQIEVIHAGLECGVIGAKYPGLQMLSLGPTIRHLHTPNECLNVADVGKIIKFLLELFKHLVD